MFVAGLCIRKKKDKEIFSRLPLYDPADYEVLLKYQSGPQPVQQYWEITCTSLKAGKDPHKTIIQDMYTWTKSLAGKTTSTQPIGIRSKYMYGQQYKAVMSVSIILDPVLKYVNIVCVCVCVCV